MIRIFAVSLLLCSLGSFAFSQVDADETIDSVDQIVASGIALKVELIFSRINNAAGDGGIGLENIPEYFQKCIATLDNDRKSFSDTNSGNQMREAAQNMARTLDMIYTGIPSENEEFMLYLKQNDMDLNAPDPEKLAKLVNQEFKTFLTTCKVPASIFKFEKMRDLIDPSPENDLLPFKVEE